MRAAVVAAAAASAPLHAAALGGGLRCLALPDRSPDDLGYAISIVCDPRHIDCAPINPGGASFWPNTIYAHSNWAFDAFWQAKGNGSAAFCTGTAAAGVGIPDGKAGVFNCSAASACSRCRMRGGVTDAAANDVVGYLCNTSPGILGPMCSVVQQGGSMENATAQEKASYLADLYYQPLRCDVGAAACDFGGSGEAVAVPCDAAAA